MNSKIVMKLLFFVLIFHTPIAYALPDETINEKALAENWFTAVSRDNMKASISIAQKLVPNPRRDIPETYVKLAQKEGINKRFFTAPFNLWDFNRWHSAYFWSQLSKETLTVKAMFHLVGSNIEREEHQIGQFDRAPWPYWIWKRRFGVCDRQAWVMCELAYQRGWETQIVYLIDPETKMSPHTVCELRKGEKVWFVDPYLNTILPTSTEALVKHEDALRSLWPEHEKKQKLQNSLIHSIFFTPSYPQDYCPRNQELYGILKKHLGGSCPRFGVPPKDRLIRYRDLAKKNNHDRFPFRMELWFYPFRILKEDIIRYCTQYGITFLN